MTTERKLYITKNWVVAILLYYSLIFIIATYKATSLLIDLSSKLEITAAYIFESALVGSMSIAISASAIAYIRKLYKLCFSYASSQDNDDQLHLKQLGTAFYFFTRPLFAVAFAILIVVGMRSGMVAASKAVTFDEGFVYVCMFFSFYAGFLSGEAIKNIERYGKNKLNQVTK